MLAQSSGYIKAAIARLRKRLDEPSTGTRGKYSDRNLLDEIGDAYGHILMDVYNVAQCPVESYADITLAADVSYYQLPPTVGEVRRVMVLSTNGDEVADLPRRQEGHPLGQGWRQDAMQRLVLEPIPSGAGTWRIYYIPSGELHLHVGKLAAATASASGFRLGSGGAISLGELDRRPNAYIGAVVNLFGHEQPNALPSGYSYYPLQQRAIQTYSVQTGAVTVRPDFDFNLGTSGNLDQDAQTLYQQYEVYPVELPHLWPLLIRYVCRELLAVEGRDARWKLADRHYQDLKRSLAVRLANSQTRTPTSWNSLNIDNLEWGAPDMGGTL